MEYLFAEQLTNEYHEISYEQIRLLYEENERNAREVNAVTQSSNRGETYYPDGKGGIGKELNWRQAFYKEILYRDIKTDGFIMTYPHGSVIRQGERNHYYRGENRRFPKSQPTYFRALDKCSTDEERRLFRLVANLRIEEFKSFISLFDVVKQWQYGDVLFEPLAQHYGIETQWLDITNDFNVALFFATCYWDNESNAFFPLTKKQTDEIEASKYGVIFHIPALRTMINNCGLLSKTPEKFNVILPIGYQPFMRCQSQNAYGIRMEQSFPLQEDNSFEKLYFRHNEKLSQAVFDLMDGGNKIYPQEGIGEFDDIIKQITETVEFSEEAFENICNNLSVKEKNAACALLHTAKLFGRKCKIINKHPYSVSRPRICAMNRKYVGYALEKSGIFPSSRLVYYPTEND